MPDSMPIMVCGYQRGARSHNMCVTCSNILLLDGLSVYAGGLSPPPPLFNKLSNLETDFHKARRAAYQKACTNDSSSSSSNEDEDRKEMGGGGTMRKKLWVQCDHPRCQKWRRLPSDTQIDTKT